MPEGYSAGTFGANLMAGFLRGLTRKYERRQGEKREDELLAGRREEERARIGEQRGYQTGVREEAYGRQTERDTAQHEKDILMEGLRHTHRMAENRARAGATPKTKIKTLGDAVALAKKSFPSYSKPVWEQMGQVMLLEGIDDPYKAAVIYFTKRQRGEELPGLLPTAPESPTQRTKRRSDQVKHLEKTGIGNEFREAMGDHPEVFSKERTNANEYALGVADVMLQIEDGIRAGQMSETEGMTARMQAHTNVVAAGYTGTPGANYSDGVAMMALSPQTQEKLVGLGLNNPVNIDPQALNDAISKATREDAVVFGAAENVSFEDIILKLIQNGYREEDIIEIVREIFEPTGPTTPIENTGIGQVFRNISSTAIRFGGKR